MATRAHTTRRAVFAGLAAGIAGGVPALAAPADPIFAAIEAHRAAADVFERAWIAWDEADSFVLVNKTKLDAAQRRRIADLKTEADQLDGAAAATFVSLLAVKPTTFAGLRAITEYLACDYAGVVEPAHHYERGSLDEQALAAIVATIRDFTLAA